MAAAAAQSQADRLDKIEKTLQELAAFMAAKNGGGRRQRAGDDDSDETNDDDDDDATAASDESKAHALAMQRGLASPIVLATPSAWSSSGASPAELRAALVAEFCPTGGPQTPRDRETAAVICEALSQWAAAPGDTACAETLVDVLFWLRAPPGPKTQAAFASLRCEGLSRKHRKFAAATSGSTAATTTSASSQDRAPLRASPSAGRVPKERFAALSAEEKRAVSAAHALLKKHGAF
jgi:hypothetical protein